MSIEKLLSQKWEYRISRNLSIWHDELYVRYKDKLYPKYKLPSFAEVKLHRGFYTDFYYKTEGPGSVNKMMEALDKKFEGASYITFLKKVYPRNGRELIHLVKRANVEPWKLKDFFQFYAYCQGMLDITALGSKVVTKRVLDLLRHYPNVNEIIEYYGAPKILAPIQKLRKEIVKSKRKEFIKKLYKKYCWIPANFVSEEWTECEFAEQIKLHLLQKYHPTKKPKTILSSEEKHYLKILSDVAGLNEYRKAVFSQACFIIRPLFDRIGKPYGLGWRDVNLLRSDEIIDLSKGIGDYQKALVAKRKKICAIYSNGPGKIDIAYGREAIEFENKFKLKPTGVKNITGTVANKGKIIGQAKIIFEPKDFPKFEKGDILVARMTSIDFMPIMVKAGAFVTDEGGLACHAAIISRELGIPCIIGTKIATQVLKDGDIVEVNANHGVVTVIKRA